ncbi:hypothetical protein FRC08_012193 [Ceratobasidium sp. 394]|nr:hypothetical protein FRC08_012193 [Ceratobasidium sp. 394]
MNSPTHILAGLLFCHQWPTIPCSEWQAQGSQRYHEQREENQQEADRLALVKEKQKMLRRERDQARKRAYRARQKRLRDTLLPQDQNQGLDTNTGNNPNPARRATALLSRPHSIVYQLDNKPP